MKPKIFKDLKEKITDRTAKVAVIGLGYVGLPLAVEKVKVGYQVIGFDNNKKRVNKINSAISYIKDVTEDELKSVIDSKKLIATNDFNLLKEQDIIIIAVPTPLTKNLTPNLEFIESVSQEISRNLKKGQLICLESTTYPGTTDEVILPILEKSGLNGGMDFLLAHSPERVDPGNKRYTTKNISKIVGGIDQSSTDLATYFYQQTISQVIKLSNTKAAELTKVFENTFRAVNIALVNELTLLADKMNLDIWEVLDAASTKPFGIMSFYPGPGVGGHCIPIDPHYLEWKAKELNFNTHFINLAGEINRKMPEFVKDKSFRILNQFSIAARKSKILIIGMAYKKDLSDHRESPSVRIAELLLKEGAKVSYHDQFVPDIEIYKEKLTSLKLSSQVLKSFDLVLILTAHSYLDYKKIVENSRCVFDTRNATKEVKANREKIILL